MYVVCTQAVFVCSEVGVSPDGMAADGIDQHPVHTCSEVDGSWALTHVTEGSSLTALNKGRNPSMCVFVKLFQIMPPNIRVPDLEEAHQV